VVTYFKGVQELRIAGDGHSRNPVPLIDTFRALHSDATDVGTFHSVKGSRSNSKIDYIFAQPGTKVLQTEILHDNKDNRYPSDHFPVMAFLRLRGRADN